MTAVTSPLVLPISHVAAETPRTRFVRVALRGTLFPFRPGQAVELAVAGHPLAKPYSIACSPAQARERDSLEFLLQVGEAETPGPHLSPLEPGVLVQVGEPLGALVFPDRDIPENLLFVAGGAGIAPLRSMIWHAIETLPDVRPRLLYSARGHREFAFAREFHQLAEEGRIHLRETITRATDKGWTGYRGRIAHAHLESLVEGEDLLCFVCGPPSFVDGVAALLTRCGVPSERILTEGWG